MRVPWSQRAWRRVLVYGLGLSGLAASRFLRSREVAVVGVDRRSQGELELAELASDPEMELRCGTEPEALPPDLDGVVVSPGVPLDRPLLRAARRAGLAVIAEVELAFPFLNGPVVGITGSNGKSTTSAMTARLLELAGHAVELCGNIGVPMSSRVEGPEGRVFVAELSSFQLQTIDTFRPRAAALLNLAADHLDRHRRFEDYAAAKRRLFRRQQPGDAAVLNADDETAASTRVPGRRRLFSRTVPVEDGCYLDGESVREVTPDRGSVLLFHRRHLTVQGLHNLENAMAAALLVRSLDVPPETIQEGLEGYRGLPHRLELVARRRGVEWYDDSKATNVAATLRSLEGFADDGVHLILGGRRKGDDPLVLAAMVGRKVRCLYLIGESAEELERSLGRVAPARLCGGMERAVAEAAAAAREGEAVLLSPACASYDQYRSFSERGEHFQQLVRSLPGGTE